MINWNIIPSHEKLIDSLKQRKVSFVIETRKNEASLVSWNGELSTGEYFLLMLSNGVLIVSVTERLMMLELDVKAVSYINDVKPIIESSSMVKRTEMLLKAKRDDLPKLTSSVTFNDILTFLSWTFENENVKVEEILT